jgi:hypothetical protein
MGSACILACPSRRLAAKKKAHEIWKTRHISLPGLNAVGEGADRCTRGRVRSPD